MGKRSLERLRAEVLNLPEPDRAELAHDLITSLDGPLEPGVSDAWDAEILRRLAEIDTGAARLINRNEFSKRVRDSLKRRR